MALVKSKLLATWDWKKWLFNVYSKTPQFKPEFGPEF